MDFGKGLMVTREVQELIIKITPDLIANVWIKTHHTRIQKKDLTDNPLQRRKLIYGKFGKNMEYDRFYKPNRSENCCS